MPSSPGDLKSAHISPPASSSANCPLPAASAKPLKANQTLNGAHSPRDGGGEGSPPPQSSTGHAAAGNQPGQQSHHCNSSGASAPKASATSSQSGPGSAAPPVPLGGEQLTFATAAAPSPNVRQISKLKRFLTTLHQFACDISSDVGQRVHALVTGLVNSTITIEDFHEKIQQTTRYPLRPYVVPFLRLHLPILQQEIMHYARLAKLTPAQYVRQHESLILDTVASAGSLVAGEPFEIFQPTQDMGIKDHGKRRLSPEARKENVAYNSEDKSNSHDGQGPPAKRHQPMHSPSSGGAPRVSPAGITPALLHTPVSGHHHHANASSAPSILQSHLSAQARAALFEAEARERDREGGPPAPFHGNGNGRADAPPNGRPHHGAEHFERERYVSAAERYEKEYFSRPGHMYYSDLQRNYSEEITRDMEEEWKNIHTMLNCILGMVEKTKRALAILQHRSLEQVSTSMWSPPGRARLYQHSLEAGHSPVDYHNLKKTRAEHVAPSAAHYPKAPVPTDVDRLSMAAIEVLRRPRPLGNGLDAVNDVKRQAVVELQKAVTAAESKASELVAVERAKMERMLSEARRQAAEDALTAINHQEDNTENCWNCGRKANETCSGCNIARYCGAFCQHKDWENHHRICGQGAREPGPNVSPQPSNSHGTQSMAVDLKRVKSSPSPPSNPSGHVNGNAGQARNGSSVASAGSAEKTAVE